jgi:hypothetical protein
VQANTQPSASLSSRFRAYAYIGIAPHAITTDCTTNNMLVEEKIHMNGTSNNKMNDV